MLNYPFVLMLHRAGERDSKRISANQNMVVEPGEIERFVISVRKKSWKIISLDELCSELSKGVFPKKTMALTFDDGYCDNFTHAYPVLKSLGAPFCVYVTTGFIDSQAIPWWYRLERFLDTAHEVTLGGVGHFAWRDLKEKNDAFMMLRDCIMQGNKKSEELLALIDEVANSSSSDFDRLFMNWDEVLTLSNDDLVTIGAHTHSHPVLSRLPTDEARWEMQSSKELLEEKLRKTVSHFAFPFGGVNEVSRREIQLAKDLNFRSAVTTRACSIRNLQSDLLFDLPRIFFGPEFSLRGMQLALIRLQLSKLVKDIIRHEAN